MVRLRSLILVAACVLMAAPAAGYTLVSKEGRFSAEFPAQPKFQKSSGMIDAGYNVDRYQWLLDKGSVAWMVIYADYRAADVERLGAETMYDNGTEGAVDRIKGRLMQSRSIDHRGMRGHEIFVLDASATTLLRQRFFVSGNRLFQTIYVGPIGSERNANVEAFLNSFQIFK